MKNNFEKLRDHFPILSQRIHGYPLAYFDNASTTQKPRYVLDEVMNFYTTSYSNVYRGIHTFAENATLLYESSRERVAHFINARPEEIIFTRGSTSGINFIASTWAEEYIHQADEIVITELEHHANLLPWQRIAHKKGALLKCIPVRFDGTLDLERLEDIISLKTKLVSCVDVSNAVGTHNDVQKIVARAKAVGAKIVIDAAQSVPHQKIDVKQMGCDFLVFSGHKVLAPTGVGVLYIKKELHDEVQPYELGGGMVEQATYFNATWRQAPHKYEAGTPPIAQAIGLGAAIDYMHKNINFDQLREHEAALCAQLIEGLAHNSRIKIMGPVEELKKRGHLVSFVVDGIHAHDVAAFLDTRGIAVRAGHHCAQPFAQKLGYDASVRASFYFYNTQDEVERLIVALNELIKSF